MSMTRGDTTTVTAAATLNSSIPPEQTLRSAGLAVAPAIVVSCVVDARLRASAYIFAIDDRSWQSRSFLTSNTAHWTWEVGPKIGGSQTLLLDIRPIVKIRHPGESGALTTAEEAGVETYPIGVHVHVPWAERPAELMSRLAETFKVAQGLVEAMSGLLAALVALAAALGIKRRRKTRSSQPAT